jgi:hypothetical protein
MHFWMGSGIPKTKILNNAFSSSQPLYCGSRILCQKTIKSPNILNFMLIFRSEGKYKIFAPEKRDLLTKKFKIYRKRFLGILFSGALLKKYFSDLKSA